MAWQAYSGYIISRYMSSSSVMVASLESTKAFQATDTSSEVPGRVMRYAFPPSVWSPDLSPLTRSIEERARPALAGWIGGGLEKLRPGPTV